MSSRFAFLICSERSGSNLITSMLNGHARISGPPPSHLFRLFGQNCGAYLPITDVRWQALLDDFMDAHATMLGKWNTAPTRDGLEAASPRRRVADLLTYAYELESADADWIFVKENYTYRFVPFLLANWPDSRFVHQVRDPRDVAASWQRTESHPGGILRAVDQWLADQEASIAVVDQLRSSDRVTRVRYEDLVSDPEGTMSVVCRDFDVDFDPGMLEPHADPRTQVNAKTVDAWTNLAKPIMRDNTRTYRRVLTEDDVRYVELVTRKIMPLFGYEPENDVQHLSDEEVVDEVRRLLPRLSPMPALAIPSQEEELRRTRRREVIDRVVARAALR